MLRAFDYIVTFTGERVYPTHPSINTIHIEDIAHALAHKCRFNGHTKQFYSIAQHSVIVNNLFPYNNLWGLLHDASEAYLPDVASTIKHLFPTLKYAEKICEDKIRERFNLPTLSTEQHDVLKKIDLAVLKLEWDALIDNPNNYDLLPHLGKDVIPVVHWKINGFWPPVEAERVFLKVFNNGQNAIWNKSSCRICL